MHSNVLAAHVPCNIEGRQSCIVRSAAGFWLLILHKLHAVSSDCFMSAWNRLQGVLQHAQRLTCCSMLQAVTVRCCNALPLAKSLSTLPCPPDIEQAKELGM